MTRYQTILVDGRNVLIRTLSSSMVQESDGAGADVAYLFLRQLSSALRPHPEARLVVTWEGGHSAARKAVLPSYKVRPPITDPKMIQLLQRMNSQQPLVEEMLGLLGVPSIRIMGLEGDDVLAELAQEVSRPVLILSNDSDFYQLLRSDVHQQRPGEDRPWTPERLLAEKGVPVCLWSSYKALIGDSSDQVPGIRGVGEVTARKVCSATKELLDAMDIDTIRPPLELQEIMSAVLKSCRALAEFGDKRAGLCEEGWRTYRRNLRLVDLCHYRQPSEVTKQIVDAADHAKATRDPVAFKAWLMRHKMVSLVAEWVMWVSPFFRGLALP